jgi:hypothetical protein
MTPLIASLIRTRRASPRRSRACGKSATGTCGTRLTAWAAPSMCARASSSRAQRQASVIKTSWARMNCARASSSTTAWSLCMQVLTTAPRLSPQVRGRARQRPRVLPAGGQPGKDGVVPHAVLVRGQARRKALGLACKCSPRRHALPHRYVGKRDEKALGQGWVQVLATAPSPLAPVPEQRLCMQVLTTAPPPQCPTGALARSSARAHQWRLVGVELGRAQVGRGA